MKAKNYHVHNKDANEINRLFDEYTMIGRSCIKETPYHLVVLALPPKKEKKKVDSKTTGRGSKRQDSTQKNRSAKTD
jgi:hypothetical protein